MSHNREQSQIDEAHSDPAADYDKYGRTISLALNDLRSKGELCDITIAVGEKHFCAHRSVLSAWSPYFRAMFTHDMVESRGGTVTLRDLDEEAVQSIIDCAYTFRLSITDLNVQTLLAAATLLQITVIQCECCDYLKTKLNAANCLGIRDIADKYSCGDLVEYANEYILDEFEEVVKNGEFLELPVDTLIAIISNDELNITSEESVYAAVMRWANHRNSQEADRTVYLSSLLQHVRFARLDINEDNRPKARYKRMKKTANISGDKLFAVSGTNLEIYDTLTNKWTSEPEMIAPSSGSALALLNGKLYLLSGSSCTDTIRYYDLSTEQWIENLAPLTSGRSYSAALAFNGFLYVIGGYNGDVSEIVEKYDPIYLTWSKCASLITRRSDHRVTVLDGCIYAVGGKNTRGKVYTVEKYDAQLDQWQQVTTMFTKRSKFGCAACDGYIYVVGGKDERDRSTATGERYHPASDRWEPILPMSQKRSGHGLAELNGLLYAVGGGSETVEVFDPAKRSWSIGASMSHELSGVQIASLKRPNGNVQ